MRHGRLNACHILNERLALEGLIWYPIGIKDAPEGVADFLADLSVFSLCRWVLQIDHILSTFLLSSLLVGLLENVCRLRQLLSYVGICLEGSVVSSLTIVNYGRLQIHQVVLRLLTATRLDSSTG